MPKATTCTCCNCGQSLSYTPDPGEHDFATCQSRMIGSPISAPTTIGHKWEAKETCECGWTSQVWPADGSAAAELAEHRAKAHTNDQDT